MATARLDSTLGDDAGWTTPPSVAGRVLRCDAGGRATVDGRFLTDDPIAALQWLDRERRGGRRWVGFVGYEMNRVFEPTAGARDPTRRAKSPLFAWLELAGRDVGQASSLSSVSDDRLEACPTSVGGNSGRWRSSFSRGAYLDAVARCVAYVAAGDAFQVNLSRRLARSPAGVDAADLYAELLRGSPAAYGGLIDLGDVAVVSNSPELFLRVDADNRVVTRPIKGTRPNAPGMRRELLDSAKDAAELHMIVDLMRNDLGRVCEVGSVRVESPREIEEHPNILHGVATVAGRLRGDVGLVELLAATFPPGSVTGCPKVRAMQIIDELEPTPRGAYCGCVGYLDPDGSLQLNVAIRTATLDRHRDVLHFGVGGGIVADSEPVAEWEETEVKARNLLAASLATRVRGQTRVASDAANVTA